MEDLELRPAGEQDYAFLSRLHYLTFYAYVFQTWSMSAAELEKIFRAEYGHQQRQVVCTGGVAIGSLLIEGHSDELFLDYIAILPEFQNRGFGTRLVRTVLAQGARQGKKVRLHVLKVNQARGLYQRLGFHIYAEDDFRYYMETISGADII